MMFGISKLFKKRKIRVICFDLDNTLCNSGDAEAETEAHISEEIYYILKKVSTKKSLQKKHGKKIKLHDNNAKPIDILRLFNEIKEFHLNSDIEPNGFSRELWISELLERLAVNINKTDLHTYAKKLENEYWKFFTPRIKLFPQTLNVLKQLKEVGKYTLVMLTNSDGGREFKLGRIRALSLESYFDKIIISNDTSLNKPAIENFEYVINELDVSADECIMIGDHPEVDLINAKKLGFVTVWTKEYLKTDIHQNYVDHEVMDIGQIIDVLKKYN